MEWKQLEWGDSRPEDHQDLSKVVIKKEEDLTMDLR
jgi:hypothetical protein